VVRTSGAVVACACRAGNEHAVMIALKAKASRIPKIRITSPIEYEYGRTFCLTSIGNAILKITNKRILFDTCLLG
jgi:hypothetical protein